MLAYDLFLLNKEYTGSNVRREKPVKKVFFEKGKIWLDRKTPQNYGSEIQNNLQDVLSMPLNTSQELCLPNRTTGRNQPTPYVELYGSMLTRKSGKIFTISRTGKDKTSRHAKIVFEASLNPQTKRRTITAEGASLLNIERKYYNVSGKSLFEMYVESGILTDDGELPASVFRGVCDRFFDYVEEQWTDDIKIRQMRFSLFLLPTENPVEYRDSSPSSEANLEIDSFGNSFSGFPDKPTQTAKFLSYDDPAFAINLAKKGRFYENLFIGNTSHEKINLPAQNVMEISGLKWIFADLLNPSSRFEETHGGLYHQLFKNYRKLEEKTGDYYGAKIQMKVVCFKETQAKVEVLIDENLTMQHMNKIFSGVKEEDVEPLALELLIKKNRQDIDWSDYIGAVKTLVGRRRTESTWLARTLSKMVRGNLREWIEKPSLARDFFKKSEFCERVLTLSLNPHSVNEAEDYAYRAGKVAGRYIKFKEGVQETSNSLRDILTYSKYDRDKLRFVIQRVSLGISLSRAERPDLDSVSRFVKDEISMVKEIPDGDAHNDYSYFFYKGAFEELG